jgi:hypothetical protein
MMQPRLSAIGIAATALELRPRVVCTITVFRLVSAQHNTVREPSHSLQAAGVFEDHRAVSMKLSRDFNL